jgi:hypothetical protein
MSATRREIEDDFYYEQLVDNMPVCSDYNDEEEDDFEDEEEDEY